MLEFRLPDVGEGIANAEIIAWQVAVGDHVREHQDLVEIQTDKATVVIPCPASGVVARLCAEEGDTVDVGTVLAVFEADGDGATRSAVPLAAPTTRRLARELGVALEAIEGSGPHGRIVSEDVERAAAAAAPASSAAGTAPSAAPAPPPPSPPAPAAGEVIPLRGVRRTIAHILTRAWLEVPRIVDYRELDAASLLRARDGLRQQARDRGDEALAKALTATPFVVRAAVLAAQQHPYVNASIDLEREEITLHGHYHVGIATAGPDGLTVPVVHDADRRSLADIAREIAALAQAARERRLNPQQLSGATFTVNNFGSLGTWMGTPIVRPPEVVNLGVGAIRDRVVAVDGVPVVRPTLVLSSAADHRLLDGDTLAAFVNDVARLLEEPVLLFEDLR